MSSSGQYFYRCFSETSAGDLICGQGRVGPRLSKSDLFRQFELHNDLQNRIPTALVSVSDRPIEALHRAFDKYYNWGEDPSTIWIAVISVAVTHCGEKPYHHAQELADGDDRLKHEYLFEWKIPKQSVKHTAVETLLSRGLDLEMYLDHDHNNGDRLPSLQTVRSIMAEGTSDASIDGYGFGRYLANIARCFGARAPTQEIALRLLEDCPRYFRVIREDQSVKWQSYTKDFSWILDGIEEGLIDFWLADSTFVHEFLAF
ncbi:hypothetical protein N7530_012677 [Penicillium desertorum]|uniref:DUF7587 domain-containing protein n=1 Tax=Penicillium desertorum TaxID=1303715 RepID=A0A9W9WDN2_9EURO|nr:hypothetical protein N7530_012677 [Penicillium desertorum]